MTGENSLSIKNWAEDDKPREKLMLKGKNALSDAELLAILIGSGSRNESAVSLSQRILNQSSNNLNELGKLSLNQLTDFKGIGEAKAITIIAAMELARRRRSEESREIKKITTPKEVFEIMQPLIGELHHEEFWIMYMNNANKILSKSKHSSGGIIGTVIDLRLILKTALENNALGIILIHNHPSGNVKPSEEDIKNTQKIKLAGQHLQITLLDHIIISANNYFSFNQNEML